MPRQTKAVAADATAAASDSPLEDQIGWVIANQVRARRQEVGLTMIQVAERTGISKGMLSKI